MQRRDMIRGAGGLAMAGLIGGTAQGQAPTRWDVSLPWGPSEFHTTNAQRFATEVRNATNGAVQMTVHPGGSLGRRLLTLVSDVMRTGDALPTVPSGASLPAAILEVTRKRMGMTAVVAPDGLLAGLFTDGDLRRVLERTTEFGRLTVDEVMTRSPTAIAPDALAVEAVRRMEERRISQLPVVDAKGRMVGALHIHDLLIARVV